MYKLHDEFVKLHDRTKESKVLKWRERYMHPKTKDIKLWNAIFERDLKKKKKRNSVNVGRKI